MAHLITGYAGVEHIKASDDGAFNTGVVGSGKYVFNTGNKFGYEIVSNNLIKIKDGDLMNHGRHMNIPAGDVEECVIENGLQSVSRHDLIVMRYQKDVETGIESASLVVIKGTSSASPSDPSYVKGNIYDGEAKDDFPLYRVRLKGLTIEGVDRLFEVTPSIETLQVELSRAQSELESVQNELATKHNYGYSTLNPTDPSLIAGSERKFSTYNGRKFTDYQTYIFVLIFNGTIRATREVTQGLFATTSHFAVTLSTVDSANVQYWAEVNWISDTSYKVNASSNLSGRVPHLYVFGCS